MKGLLLELGVEKFLGKRHTPRAAWAGSAGELFLRAVIHDALGFAFAGVDMIL